jgi:hypothetical protein
MNDIKDTNAIKARLVELVRSLDERVHLFRGQAGFEASRLERDAITWEIERTLREDLGRTEVRRVCLCPRDRMTRYSRTRDWTHPVLVRSWDGTWSDNEPIDRYLT